MCACACWNAVRVSCRVHGFVILSGGVAEGSLVDLNNHSTINLGETPSLLLKSTDVCVRM